MESAEAEIIFRTVVVIVEEKFHLRWLSGVGKDAKFETTSLGWFVGLAGSHESLYAGSIRPNMEVGDIAITKITFHKESHA